MDKATQVELSNSKPWQADVAQVEKDLGRIREQEAWKRFGTIGFNAYQEWVLQNNRSFRCTTP